MNEPTQHNIDPQSAELSFINSKKSHKLRWAIAMALILLLGALSIILGGFYYSAIQGAKAINERDMGNANVVTFQKLFVEKVLTTQGEVSYEDRLKLENAATNTKDEEIKAAWEAFLASATETEAQENVLVLLTLFANKIVY